MANSTKNSTTPYSIHELLKTLNDQCGSDLHIHAGSPPRVRIHGKIRSLDVPPLTPYQSRDLCYSLIHEHQQKDFEKTKELDFGFSIKGIGRFRGNLSYNQECVGGTFRTIPTKILTLSELGMPDIISSFTKLRTGLVLVCGGTGSGKSTTLAAIIDEINRYTNGKIITIEEPIEFIHPHKNCVVSQRAVGGDTYSFNAALKSALRQDPDVIMVGEMRDLETVQLAISAAETGHVVFGTMHTQSAVSTLHRVIDIFPADKQQQIRAQLSFSLAGVVNQILTPSAKSGRVLALEVMIPNTAIKHNIRENKLHMIYSSMQTGQDKSGMITLNQSLITLIEQGHINYAQAINLSSEPEELVETINKRFGSKKIA